MEHKKRKMFAAIAVIMLCAVAIVGVGYAYTANTTNSGNTVDSEYVTISQSGTGAYQFSDNSKKLTWDTVDEKDTAVGHTDKHKTTFTISSTYTPAAIPLVIGTGESTKETYTVAQVGETVTLHVEPQTGGSVINKLYCAVSSTTGFTLETGVCVFLEIDAGEVVTYMKLTANNTFNTNSAAADAAPVWDGASKFIVENNSTAYTDATVKVYIGYQGTTGIVVDNLAYGVAAQISDTITGANLIFTLNSAQVAP